MTLDILKNLEVCFVLIRLKSPGKDIKAFLGKKQGSNFKDIGIRSYS